MAPEFLNEKQRYYARLCAELALLPFNSPDAIAITEACEQAWRDMNALEQQAVDDHLTWLAEKRPAPHLRIKHNG